MKPLLIYVSGPITNSDPNQRILNIERACDAAIAVMDKGHHVIVPHLYEKLEHKRILSKGSGWPYDRYMEMDRVLVGVSDALLRISPSPGSDIELGWAIALRKILFYSVQEIPEVDE